MGNTQHLWEESQIVYTCIDLFAEIALSETFGAENFWKFRTQRGSNKRSGWPNNLALRSARWSSRSVHSGGRALFFQRQTNRNTRSASSFRPARGLFGQVIFFFSGARVRAALMFYCFQ